MASLSQLSAYVPPLLTPMHPALPFPILDLFGAMRLSSVVNWFATGAFDAPPAKAVENGEKGTPSKRVRAPQRRRATLLQECFGILVIVFGGETFLCT